MTDINNATRYLFRGKRIDNGEWVDGNLINKISPHEVENVFWCSLIHDGALTAVKVDPSTVGQWVWRKDKNYTKLFVGDIYKRFNYIYLVEFDETEKRFVGLCIGREKDFEKGSYEPPEESPKSKVYELPTDDTMTEIIGNRWNNPDLLK